MCPSKHEPFDEHSVDEHVVDVHRQLFEAAKIGRIQVIADIIRLNPELDLNFIIDGTPLLHEAARNVNIFLARLLINNGINLNIVDELERTPTDVLRQQTDDMVVVPEGFWGLLAPPAEPDEDPLDQMDDYRGGNETHDADVLPHLVGAGFPLQHGAS